VATEGSGDTDDVSPAAPWDEAWLPVWINEMDPGDTPAEPEAPEDRLAAELLAADLRAVDRLAAEILAAEVLALAAPPDEPITRESTAPAPPTEEAPADEPVVEAVALQPAPAPRVQRPPARRRRAWLLAPLALLAAGVVGGVSLWVTASARPAPTAAQQDRSAEASLRSWSTADVPPAPSSPAAETSSAAAPSRVEQPAVLHRVAVRVQTAAGESATRIGPP
jgi:hypothetical protein